MIDSSKDSALIVNEGIEQPPIVNPYITNFFKKNRVKEFSVAEYVDGILAGNRTILSQAITLIESSRSDHRAMAQKVIEACIPYGVRSKRIGITGVPGAGKSTCIEAFGGLITTTGHNRICMFNMINKRQNMF